MASIPIGRVMTRSAYLAVLLAALLLNVGCSSIQGGPAIAGEVANSPEPARSIVLGKVDSEPTDAILAWQPTVEYLAANLGGPHAWVGEVKISSDTGTMSRWLMEGEVDLVIDSIYPAMIVAETSGAQPFLFRNTSKPDKNAVFFVRSDSGVASIDALKGRVIGLAERHSTSGFMLPMAYMKKEGLHPIEVSGNGSPVGPEEVGYIFAGDDDVVAQWVLNGTVIAGVVDQRTFSNFENSNAGMLDDLALTEGISSSAILLVRSDLNPDLRESIKKVLVDMDTTEQGKAILNSKSDGVDFTEVKTDVGGPWEQAMVFYDLIRD
jgi:phosphonate transport system substrate-binding protein